MRQDRGGIAKREQENAQRLLNRMAMLQAAEEQRMIIQLEQIERLYF